MADDNNWQKLMDEGIKLFEQKRSAQAEMRFVDAVKLSEKFADDDPRRATGLNNLAALYHSQGKYAFAEDCYKRALAINKKIYGSESLEVARNMYNLAVLYSAKARYVEAETLYSNALSIRENLLGYDHPDLVAHLKQYSELLRRLGRDIESKLLLMRAQEIGTKQ